MPKVFFPKQLEALAEIAATIHKQEKRCAIHRRASTKRYYGDLDAARASARMRSKAYRDKKKKLAAEQSPEAEMDMALPSPSSSSHTTGVAEVSPPQPRPQSLVILADYSSGDESD
ncbi:hypothetical protein FA13DRAFT_1797539 [Coprinellus micaceus]|uniref:Uncharacterized protein n=1 Tax=Coprinellus micaceus TaxID=71717 RepID=A0A4Y7SSC8_COPMI|nr:hypothetical protein FA13DRAFT_1802147 [Coprinellus micaceus]TEB24169.1 hypothetical protein FA13DRAFT_1797539 [Coprinellus micaceus]